MEPISAAIIMAAIAAGAEVGKIFFANRSATSRKDALSLQLAETQLKHNQQSIANYDTMTKLLDKQTAQLSVRGVSYASPSFNAIERDTINTGRKAQKNLDIEESIEEYNLRQEKRNVNDTLYAQIFGATAETASNAVTIAADLPSKG